MPSLSPSESHGAGALCASVCFTNACLAPDAKYVVSSTGGRKPIYVTCFGPPEPKRRAPFLIRRPKNTSFGFAESNGPFSHQVGSLFVPVWLTSAVALAGHAKFFCLLHVRAPYHSRVQSARNWDPHRREKCAHRGSRVHFFDQPPMTG